MTTSHLVTRPASVTEWDAAWAACAHHTRYQSRAWPEDRATSTRGLRWFDLNLSRGHAGVATFEEGVGAVALPAPVLVGERRGPHLWPGAGRRVPETAA